MGLFIQSPLLAILPAVLFLAAYSRWPRRTALYAGIVWLLYAGYELGMQKRWFCTGECNIRVDLLLIYPLLLAISVAGMVAVVRASKSGKSKG